MAVYEFWPVGRNLNQVGDTAQGLENAITNLLHAARDELEAQLERESAQFDVVSHSLTLSPDGRYGVVTFLLRRD